MGKFKTEPVLKKGNRLLFFTPDDLPTYRLPVGRAGRRFTVQSLCLTLLSLRLTVARFNQRVIQDGMFPFS